jgi:hypothetical protein
MSRSKACESMRKYVVGVTYIPMYVCCVVVVDFYPSFGSLLVADVSSSRD